MRWEAQGNGREIDEKQGSKERSVGGREKLDETRQMKQGSLKEESSEYPIKSIQAHINPSSPTT